MEEITNYVSIVIPCRNEEGFIENVLLDIFHQDYPGHLLEILVIDGMSDDQTVQIVEQYQKSHASLKLIPNPEKIVPTALNRGIKESKGSIIVRLDAHCRYPRNYISYLVSHLHKLQADNVGVAVVSKAKSKSLKATAIAASMGSAFGIGNSDFRTGSKIIQKTDTVPFGCFRKSVFDEIGLFDEELIRNQDDEFNARMIKNGYKIYILPDIKITYYTRDNFSQAAHMFYYYGLFKPLVNKKLGTFATFRQFIPPLFVLANVLLLIFSIIHVVFFYLFVAMWISYILLALFFSIQKTKEIKHLALLLAMPVCFIIFHFSYGLGYLKGILKYFIFRKKQVLKDIEIKR